MITGDAGRERLKLPAERRVRRKAEFTAAYAHGKRLGNGMFGVTVYSREQSQQRSESPALRDGHARGARRLVSGPRIGLAVAVRVAGNSVRRNRIRRLIRESFRLHQHELPEADLVVSARPGARDAAAPELRAALAALWKKVAERCARPPLP